MDPTAGRRGAGAMGGSHARAGRRRRAISEGVEDALTYAAAGYTAWAAGSAPFIPALIASIPDFIDCFIFERHPDEAAHRAFAKLEALLAERGGECPPEITIRDAVA